MPVQKAQCSKFKRLAQIDSLGLPIWRNIQELNGSLVKIRLLSREMPEARTRNLEMALVNNVKFFPLYKN